MSKKDGYSTGRLRIVVTRESSSTPQEGEAVGTNQKASSKSFVVI
jgi:hypothetical protein